MPRYDDVINEAPTEEDLQQIKTEPRFSDELLAEAPTEEDLALTEPAGYLETAIRGLGQGLTSSYHDELAAGLGATMAGNLPLSEDWEKEYKKRRDFIRARMDIAREQNPKTWAAFNIGGSVAGAGKIAKAAKKVGSAALGKKAIKEAAPEVGKELTKKQKFIAGALGLGGYGALDATGMSEAELLDGELGELAEDAAKGAAVGLASGGVLKGGAETAKFVFKTMPKKFIRSFSGVPEKHLTRFMQDPDRVTQARPEAEIAADVMQNLEKLRNRITKGSSDALEALPENQTAVINEVFTELQSNIRRLQGTTITDESAAAIAELLRIQDRLYLIAKREKGAGNLYRFLPLRKIKPIIQDLDNSLDYSRKQNRWMLPGERAKHNVRRSFDKILKEDNDEYAEKMLKVAEDTKAHNELSTFFKNDNAAVNQIRALGFRHERLPEQTTALKNFDKVMKTNFFEENLDRITKESFDKANVQGSRNVKLGGALGAAIGGTSGLMAGGPMGALVGGLSGAAGGAMAGGSLLDFYSGAMARQGLKQYSKISPLFNKPGKYGEMLREAAKRGESSVAATHFILMQTDPNYREKVNQE
jgi:hypothetical protein